MTARRKRLLTAAALLLLAVGCFGFALARSAALRHGAAKSLRAALGPPAPPALLIDEDEPGILAEQPEQLRRVLIPDAASPTPAPVARPNDLAGVSLVLLLGADNRSDKVTGRTDTMMVAAFRHRDGKVAVFSIPRDLWVPLPDLGTLHEQGRTHARISSVIRVGEVRLGRGQGLPLLRQVLREQLGLRIDRYAMIDFAGFVGLVDELGGVEVDVECPIMDCFWVNGTDQPCEMLDIPAGRVAMDGATALKFVRSRHGTGDHDRTRRQQAVMLAFARKVQARGLRGLRPLWRQAAPFVSTDLETEDAAYYASFALENRLSDVHGFAIKHPMVSRHVTEDRKHVILLDRERFDAALARMFEGELPAHRGRRRCPDPDAALR
jgi:LCP family protein required for cell wall assembly